MITRRPVLVAILGALTVMVIALDPRAGLPTPARTRPAARGPSDRRPRAPITPEESAVGVRSVWRVAQRTHSSHAREWRLESAALDLTPSELSARWPSHARRSVVGSRSWRTLSERLWVPVGASLPFL
jgi:hypothetical protein